MFLFFTAFPRHASVALWAPQCGCVVVHGGAVINRESHRLGVIAHTGKFFLTGDWPSTGWVNANPSDLNDFHPPPRTEHSAVLYTAPGDRRELAVFYGGFGNALGWVRGDVVIFDVNEVRWHTAKQAGRNSTGHSALIRNADMYVFGGWNGGDVFYTDVAIFDVVHEIWSYPQTAGLTPSPRRHAAFARITIDETKHDYALLIGGFALHDYAMLTTKQPRDAFETEGGQWQCDYEKRHADGLWRLDFDTLTWTLLVEDSSGSPPPRLYWPVTLFYSDPGAKTHELIVYGGAVDGASSRAVADVWRLQLNHCPAGMAGADCATKIDCTELGGCALGAGVCVGANECRCKSGFAGKRCESFNCDYFFGCSGGGNCTSANYCVCDEAHEGEACQYEKGARASGRFGGVDATMPDGNATGAKSAPPLWTNGSTASGPWVALIAVLLGIVVVVYGACAAIKSSWAPLSAGVQPRSDRYSKNLEL